MNQRKWTTVTRCKYAYHPINNCYIQCKNKLSDEQDCHSQTLLFLPEIQRLSSQRLIPFQLQRPCLIIFKEHFMRWCFEVGKADVIVDWIYLCNICLYIMIIVYGEHAIKWHPFVVILILDCPKYIYIIPPHTLHFLDKLQQRHHGTELLTLFRDYYYLLDRRRLAPLTILDSAPRLAFDTCRKRAKQHTQSLNDVHWASIHVLAA